MNIRELMVKEVTSCSPDTDLETAGRMMWDHNCGAIPVLDNEDHPIGVVTDRDIAMSAVLNHKPLWEISARDVIGTREVFTCNIDDDIQSALSMMQTHKIRRLPIIDSDGCLRGILTIDDIVAGSKKMEGKTTPPLSYEDAMGTMKAVCFQH
jgi:CBS domain-containing protein